MPRRPKWTLDALKKWASGNFSGYEVVGISNREVGSNSRNVRFVILRCSNYPNHNQYETQLGNFLSGKGCKKCSEWDFDSANNIIKKSGFTLIRIYMKEVRADGTREKYVVLKCNNNHEPFEARLQNVVSEQYACSSCRINNWVINDVERWLSENEPTYSVIRLYYKNFGDQKYRFATLKCENTEHPEYDADLKHFISSSIYRCRLCTGTQSSGETEIERFLIANEVGYIKQYHFNDCYYKGKLRFDFAVLNSLGKVHFLVEFDGQQHYQPVTFGGMPYDDAVKLHKENKTRDMIKDQYCAIKEIALIRIPYWEFNNVEEILSTALNSSQ